MAYVEKESIQQLFVARGFSYDVLRRIFLVEPNRNLLLALQSGILKSFPFIDEHLLIREGVDTIHSFFEQYQVDEIYEDLHWDYTRMFIGPYELKAPLWESAYLNKDQLLFQQETIVVRQAYLKYQFLPANFGAEADDHLGLELDFLYQLNRLVKKGLREGNTDKVKDIIHDQIAFLDNHLLRWIPSFKEKVLNHAQYDFYKGIVKILQGFLELDKASLEEFLAEKHLPTIQ